MVSEFPSASQRSAVCNQAWSKKHALMIEVLKRQNWTDCQIKAYLNELDSRQEN